MTTIVVGVDGSDGAKVALRWAFEEARRGGDAKIIAVSVWFAPFPVTSPWLSTIDVPIDLTEATAQALAECVTSVAGDQFAAVEVEQRVFHGAAAPVLLSQSEHADLTVVGTRGLGGFKGLLLGSVSHQVVSHARCPVVVVPEHQRTEEGRSAHRSIVVGVDGSANSIAALRWAARRAQVTGESIRATFAWRMPTVFAAPPPVSAGVPPIEIVRRAASDALEGYVADAALPADIRVEHIIVEGTAANALIEAGRLAEIVVVGARGHEGFAGLLLGSVATAVVHHAPCPVAVIPDR
jgi:nucleotide-binding universal stress UspA family protein